MCTDGDNNVTICYPNPRLFCWNFKTVRKKRESFSTYMCPFKLTAGSRPWFSFKPVSCGGECVDARRLWNTNDSTGAAKTIKMLLPTKLCVLVSRECSRFGIETKTKSAEWRINTALKGVGYTPILTVWQTNTRTLSWWLLCSSNNDWNFLDRMQRRVMQECMENNNNRYNKNK